MSNQRGTTYLILMLLIVVMSIGATAVTKQWKTLVQREQEADLMAHGIEIQVAIGAYSTTGSSSWAWTRRHQASPPPKAGYRTGPRIERFPRRAALTVVGGDTAARAHQQNCEEIDPIKQYLRDVPDPEDADWKAG